MEKQIFNQATYAKADGMAGERSLTYGVNAKGQHVVRIDLPAGEDIGPCVSRYATAEEAGRHCGEVLKAWGISGYIPAEEYWAALKLKMVAAIPCAQCFGVDNYCAANIAVCEKCGGIGIEVA